MYVSPITLSSALSALIAFKIRGVSGTPVNYPSAGLAKREGFSQGGSSTGTSVMNTLKDLSATAKAQFDPSTNTYFNNAPGDEDCYIVALYAGLEDRKKDYEKLAAKYRKNGETKDEWLWARYPDGFAPMCGSRVLGENWAWGMNVEHYQAVKDLDEWQIFVALMKFDHDDTGSFDTGDGVPGEWIKANYPVATCNGDCRDNDEE